MKTPPKARLQYYIEDGVLYANVSCDDGFLVIGSASTTEQIRCSGSTWIDAVQGCVGKENSTCLHGRSNLG